LYLIVLRDEEFCCCLLLAAAAVNDMITFFCVGWGRGWVAEACARACVLRCFPKLKNLMSIRVQP